MLHPRDVWAWFHRTSQLCCSFLLSRNVFCRLLFPSQSQRVLSPIKDNCSIHRKCIGDISKISLTATVIQCFYLRPSRHQWESVGNDRKFGRKTAGFLTTTTTPRMLRSLHPVSREKQNSSNSTATP